MTQKDRDIPLSHDERQMRTAFDAALSHRWVPADKEILAQHPEARKFELERSFAMHELFMLMMQGGGDRGHALGAKTFIALTSGILSDRVLRSHVLTLLATALFETSGSGYHVIGESEVASFGRFLRPVIDEHPQMVVQWVEDMNASDLHNDFSPMPTAVIRGALFAPAIDHTLQASFWERALASNAFPLRVFSDPCSAREGNVLSSFQQRVISTILAAVSDGDATKICAEMVANLTRKCVGDQTSGRWTETVAKASESDRRTVLSSIADTIHETSRRVLVNASFGLRSAAV